MIENHPNPPQNYPVLQRHNRLNNLFSGCYQTLKGVARSSYDRACKVHQSIIGKATIFAVAECVGALSGNSLLGNVGTLIAQNNIAATALSTYVVVIGIYKWNTHKETFNKQFRPQLILTSAIVIHIILMNEEEEELLGRIGRVLGTVLGGYAGLFLTGSPTLFFDNSNPWGCYSVSMIRYLEGGTLFNSIIATPQSAVSKALLKAPRAIICAITQTMAYNSSSTISFAKKCVVRRGVPNNTVVPFLAGTITDTFSGHSSIPLSRELTQKIIIPLHRFPTLIINEKLFERIEGFVEALTSQVLKAVASQSDVIANVIARTFNDYIHVINSRTILAAHTEFLEGFHQPEMERKKEMFEFLLEQVFNEKFPNKGPDSFGKPVKTFIQEKINEQLPLILTSIYDFEETLFGFKPLQTREPAFQKVVLEIHALRFLILCIQNLRDPKMQAQKIGDKEIILDINDFILRTYLRFIIPTPIAFCIEKIGNVSINAIFGAKNKIANFVRQCENEVVLTNAQFMTELNEMYYSNAPVEKKQKEEFVVTLNDVESLSITHETYFKPKS